MRGFGPIGIRDLTGQTSRGINLARPRLARGRFFGREGVAGRIPSLVAYGEWTPSALPGHRAWALRGSGPYAILEAVPTQQAEEVERCLVDSLAG